MAFFRYKSFFSSKLFFAAGICLLVFIVYQLGKISLVRYDMNKEISELKKESEDLEQNQDRLLKLQEFLSTDFFAEREARLKLGMQKKGEQVALVQLPNTEEGENGSAKSGEVLRDIGDDQTGQKERKKKNPAAWWDYFFANKNN